MSKIKILIADDIEETRKVIGKILFMEKERFEVVGEACNGEEVIKKIPSCKPDIVLMDINMPIMNGLEATEKLTEIYPSVMVIIMSVQAENEYLKKAMFSGAKEYIIKPINYDTLVQTLEATYLKNKERINQLSKKLENDKNAKILTFYSSKGGVGKSVISTNTAIMLSQTFNRKTLLIDLNLQYGDLALLLNLHDAKTILDLVDEHQIDSYESISHYINAFNQNLDVLLAPKNPEGGEYISKEILEKLLKNLINQYDFILIDTGVNFEETTLFALDISDWILLLTTMELSSIKNTKLGLNVMKTLNYDEKKVKIVVNAAKDSYGISDKEVKEIFKNNLFCIIPEDVKNIRSSVNKGCPICNQPKKSNLKFVKNIKEMCKKMI